MTKTLDAAWDAVHAAMNAGEVTNCLSCETCPSMPCACAEDLARAALRAALPAEPDTGALEAMAKADAEISGDWEWDHLTDRDREIYCKAERAAYRALRAHLLGEDA